MDGKIRFFLKQKEFFSNEGADVVEILATEMQKNRTN